MNRRVAQLSSWLHGVWARDRVVVLWQIDHLPISWSPEDRRGTKAQGETKVGGGFVAVKTE